MQVYYSPEGLNQDKTRCVSALRLILHHHISLILSKISDDETSTETCQEGESAQDPSKRLHGSLDIQRQVFVRHSVHLWILDVYHRGRWKPRVADSGSSAKTSCADVWNIPILPRRSIYTRRGLLRFESSCRVVLSLRHAISRMPDRENHPPIFSWSIELLVFRSNS
jgi:hypothetical protein